MASSPTKAVESLALEVPVVGTPIPSQAERIAASGSIAPFVEEPFAAAVAGLLADPPAARRMGARGRRHVRFHRSYERLAGSVEARYVALVPPGGPGVPPGAGLTGSGRGSTLRAAGPGFPPAPVDCARIPA